MPVDVVPGIDGNDYVFQLSKEDIIWRKMNMKMVWFGFMNDTVAPDGDVTSSIITGAPSFCRSNVTMNTPPDVPTGMASPFIAVTEPWGVPVKM